MPKEFRSFLPDQHEDGDETTVSRKVRLEKYVPIDEAPDPEDDAYKSYGEEEEAVSDSFETPAEEAEDVDERMTEVGNGIYAYGHYLDMDDPHDVAFLEANEENYNKTNDSKIIFDENKNIIPIKESDYDKFLNLPTTKSIGEKNIKRNELESNRKGRRLGKKKNLKTLKKRPFEQIGRFFRRDINEMKNDLFFGEKRKIAKYLDKDTVYQHDMYEEPIDEDVEKEIKMYPRKEDGEVYYYETPEGSNNDEGIQRYNQSRY